MAFETLENVDFKAGYVLAENAINEEGSVVLMRGERLERSHVEMLRLGKVPSIKVVANEKDAFSSLSTDLQKRVNATNEALFFFNRNVKDASFLWLKKVRREQLACDLLKKVNQ